MSAEHKPAVRCAIYTRKSSENGLEQSLNSLDAQREACQAFILSQRQEGWRALPTRYDDGGYSGGNLERPALQQLLADVEANKVDTIVVYRVDRLTRSLANFAKIVEALDARGVSFVSVTQQFNTTSFHGAADLQCLTLLRPVRAGGDGRKNSRQDRRLQAQRYVDGWRCSSRL
jgi:site-specific DNA recombinase